MIYKDVLFELKENSDPKYKDFIAKLVPSIDKDTIFLKKSKKLAALKFLTRQNFIIERKNFYMRFAYLR